MQSLKMLFASDAVKQCLAALALVAGVLATQAPPGKIRDISASVVAVMVALGIISGGTTGTQPAAIQEALGSPPAPTMAPPRGFVRLRLLAALAALAAVAVVASCAALSKTTVDTGDVDLGKGVTCRTTSAPTDAAACTKLVTQNCTFPLPKNADGTCPLDAVTVDIPFQPGKGARCQVSAGAGHAPCTKLVATSCTLAIPRDAAGACL